MGDEFRFADARVRARLDKGTGGFAPLGMGHGNHRRGTDSRMAVKHFLDLDRTNVLTT
ncbi:hypothetical protein D3C81_2109130 [compost metagenome]